MKQNIKLRFTEPEYFINRKKNRVRCKMNFTIEGDKNLLSSVMAFVGTTNDPISPEVIAEATPSNGDTFNVEVGMKVSRAKAETLAYKRVAKLFGRFIKYQQQVVDSISIFSDKATFIVNHNNEYVHKF